MQLRPSTASFQGWGGVWRLEATAAVTAPPLRPWGNRELGERLTLKGSGCSLIRQAGAIQVLRWQRARAGRWCEMTAPSGAGRKTGELGWL